MESADGLGSLSSDEDVQAFALMLINSVVDQLGGESMGRQPRLLRMIQDDLFHHLIHYATRSSPLVLSMICSIVLNLYHFLRRFCFNFWVCCLFGARSYILCDLGC